MSRFDRWDLRRFTARQAIWSIGLVTLLLVLFAGHAVRKQGEEMSPGSHATWSSRSGEPAGWLADRLPLADLATEATSWLSPDESLAGASHGFAARQQRLPAGGAGQAGAGGVPAVTPDYFDPAALGEKVERRPLHTLLVTGDSLSTPLDIELAQRLTGLGRRRDPRPPPRHGDLEDAVWSTGASSRRRQVAERPSRRRGRLHRRQRGLPDARARRQGRQAAAGPTGRRSTPTACAR